LSVKTLDLPYSPDLSSCDFCLFRFVKEKLHDQELLGVYAAHQAVTHVWDALTFEDAQGIFGAAQVWGTSVKRMAQQVGLDHVLKDEDVVCIKTAK
jgi:ribosome-interacting GTPase 1